MSVFAVLFHNQSGLFAICAEGRGYLGGVCEIFFMFITHLSPHSGKLKHSQAAISPPSSFKAPLASFSSSSPAAPFIGAKVPPMRTKGIQYSHSSLREATARAVATSNFSRKSADCPPPPLVHAQPRHQAPVHSAASLQNQAFCRFRQ